MYISEIAEALNIPHKKNDLITGVCIDSRKLQSGNLFVAIVGDRFDGHDFIEEAVNRGAIAVLCSKKQTGLPAFVQQFLVADTIEALGKLACFHRRRFQGPVIALTGSNGKTTVKEMIAAILPKPSYASQGNLNNHIGVPLSVLNLKQEHQSAVFELGANHIGEVAYTVNMVRPEVTLINNIAPAHIEGFGSIEGVAKAKGEIHQGLAAKGTAIINEDDAYAHYWDGILKNKKQLRFSTDKPVDFYAEAVAYNDLGCASFSLVSPQGKTKIVLQVPGEHNLRNAIAAAACTAAIGISLQHIQEGLCSFKGVPGRLTIKQGKNECRLIDDSYNANLKSVLAAINVLAQYPGQRIFVFGDMGELGAWSKEHHEEVGKKAQEQGIDLLLTCGNFSSHASESFGPKAKHYASQPELLKDLLDLVSKDTTVLVKGSRSSKMENIVESLLKVS